MSGEIKIEKGIKPLVMWTTRKVRGHKQVAHGRWKELYLKMKVGESVLLESNQAKSFTTCGAVRNDTMFRASAQIQPDGKVRCWKVKR